MTIRFNGHPMRWQIECDCGALVQGDTLDGAKAIAQLKGWSDRYCDECEERIRG